MQPSRHRHGFEHDASGQPFGRRQQNVGMAHGRTSVIERRPVLGALPGFVLFVGRTFRSMLPVGATHVRVDLSSQRWTEDHVERGREGQIDEQAESHDDVQRGIVAIVAAIGAVDQSEREQKVVEIDGKVRQEQPHGLAEKCERDFVGERFLRSSKLLSDRSRGRRGDGHACALLADLIADVDVENAVDDEWQDERVRVSNHRDLMVEKACLALDRARAVGEINPAVGADVHGEDLVDVQEKAEAGDAEENQANCARLRESFDGERPLECQCAFEREQDHHPEGRGEE